MANQKLPLGADTPLQFLIHHMVQRLLDLGQKEYVHAWIGQLKIAQATDTFNLHDAILSLEVVQKRNGGAS